MLIYYLLFRIVLWNAERSDTPGLAGLLLLLIHIIDILLTLFVVSRGVDGIELLDQVGILNRSLDGIAEDLLDVIGNILEQPRLEQPTTRLPVSSS